MPYTFDKQLLELSSFIQDGELSTGVVADTMQHVDGYSQEFWEASLGLELKEATKALTTATSAGYIADDDFIAVLKAANNVRVNTHNKLLSLVGDITKAMATPNSYSGLVQRLLLVYYYVTYLATELELRLLAATIDKDKEAK